MTGKHPKRLGLAVWSSVRNEPPDKRFALLAHLEQRARQELDLQMLRAIRECRAMLEAGELPPPDEPDDNPPHSA